MLGTMYMRVKHVTSTVTMLRANDMVTCMWTPTERDEGEADSDLQMSVKVHTVYGQLGEPCKQPS